jgi:phosphoribosylaminoimidazolecarboxamide formyltransferase/IMP cyclohydrolase
MSKRAILSVSDKRGLTELARFLVGQNYELISTGGTARHLVEAGLPVKTVSEHTGAPEILGGRVKTLHPKVFGGILFDRSNTRHLVDCQATDIGAIDLVVVNLYPFEETVSKEGVQLAEAIEQIDVGGPSMLRAAAKNFKDVVVLCSPDLYEPFMAEAKGGSVSPEFRKRCALEVFKRTAAYDAAISAYLGGTDAAPESEPLAESVTLRLTRAQSLRYGENPQQQAGFYTYSGLGVDGGAAPFEQLHGKELSYNNILDLDAAQRLATLFEAPAAAIIKHTNPCGVATGASAADALKLAIEADPVSAFGGIVATNRTFDGAAAETLGSLFLEVVVAPDFTPEALDALTKKKNLRLIRSASLARPYDLRSAAGGLLVQNSDAVGASNSWKTVTKRQPTAEEMEALKFAWTVCAVVKSNAIVITRGQQSNGVGAGQMSRVDSAKIAVMKAVHPVAGCVAASDAFFPFRDGLDLLAKAGVVAVVQPGGSVRDEEVIAAADEQGLAMVFTGERHFRH